MRPVTLEVELLEDLHIGTGTGWADIDALQVRDRLGRPVLPASHIKGLWREAADEWCRLDPAAISREDIGRLFGYPGREQGKLQLTSAYLRDGMQADHLVWGSTAIDAYGKAAEKSLRFIEYVPAGARFVMQAALPADDEKGLALLEALIARCHRLGSGRNRGHGRVRWHLATLGAAAPLATLGERVIPGRLRLLLRNLEPICLARTGHPGNLIASESFIRGRSLRGAVVADCLARGQADVAHALLAETLSWGDALPLPVDTLDASCLIDAEVLPIPLSIGTPKAKAQDASLPAWIPKAAGDVFGAREEIDQIDITAKKPEQEKLKRPASGEFLFRPNSTADWRRYRPHLLERLHTAIPDEENAHEQALFSTEEIAERTLFLADLIVTTPEQAETLAQALQPLGNRWLRIGRGGRPLVIEAAAWLPLPAHGKDTGTGFTMLLESELIARDALGNFQDRLDADILASLAGMNAQDLDIQVEPPVFSEGCELFGFNASTGLPRLAQRAIKAGSVARVTGRDAPRLRAALAKRRALGECPEEGFGRFRLDVLPKPKAPTNFSPQPKAIDPPVEERLCAEARQWVKEFGQALRAPSRSQWGEFRSRIQAARRPEDLDAAFRLIEEAKDKHGGRAWAKFVDAPDYPKLREHLARKPLTEAKAWLEYFLRWQRVQMNTPEEHR